MAVTHLPRRLPKLPLTHTYTLAPTGPCASRFTRWPPDALHTVASSFLSSLVGVEPSVAAALPDLCVLFHSSVHQLSARFLAEQRRHYYVTPTSYLELLGSYKNLLSRRQNEVRFLLGGGVV